MTTEDHAKTARAAESIGINMAPSRVKTRLTRYNLNCTFEDELERLKAAGEAADPAFADKCTALSHAKTRISDSSPIVLSCIFDKMLHNLAEQGFAKAIEQKRKTLQVEYLLDSDVVNGCGFSRLFTSTKTFTSTSAALKLEALTAAVKAAGALVPVASMGDAVVAVEVEVAADAEETEHDRSQFNSYVDKIFKDVKSSNPAFEGMRVAKDSVKFCNDLVMDCVQRFYVYLDMLLALKGSKTVDADAIMAATKIMLTDGSTPVESFTYEKVLVKGKADNGSAIEKESLVAVKKMLYPDTCYDELEAYVNSKLALWQQWKDSKGSDDKEKHEGSASASTVAVTTTTDAVVTAEAVEVVKTKPERKPRAPPKAAVAPVAPASPTTAVAAVASTPVTDASSAATTSAPATAPKAKRPPKVVAVAPVAAAAAPAAK